MPIRIFDVCKSNPFLLQSAIKSNEYNWVYPDSSNELKKLKFLEEEKKVLFKFPDILFLIIFFGVSFNLKYNLTPSYIIVIRVFFLSKLENKNVT